MEGPLETNLTRSPARAQSALCRLRFLACLIATAGFGRAEEVASPWKPSFDATVETISALHGGQRRGTVLEGGAVAGLGWQPELKADGKVTFGAFVSSLGLFGRGPTEHLVGDFLALSNLEGHHSVRLYQWWGEAKTKNWEVRVGALLADEDFAGTDVGGRFANSAFGWPAFVSANTINTGPAFYAAAPGLRLRLNISETAYWQAGIYDGDTFDSAGGDPAVNRDGLHLRVGGNQGWFGMVEMGFQPGRDGLTRLKLGAWVHSADFADVYSDKDGHSFVLSGTDPRSHSGNGGAYFMLERTVAGQPGAAGHVQGHLRAGWAPRDRNAIQWAVDSGLAVTGPLPSRPADIFAIGIAHARFGPDFRASQRELNPGDAVFDCETAIEVGYAIDLNGEFSVRPSFQFIRHPGGSRRLPNATAFLLRWEAHF